MENDAKEISDIFEEENVTLRIGSEKILNENGDSGTKNLQEKEPGMFVDVVTDEIWGIQKKVRKNFGLHRETFLKYLESIPAIPHPYKKKTLLYHLEKSREALKDFLSKPQTDPDTNIYTDENGKKFAPMGYFLKKFNFTTTFFTTLAKDIPKIIGRGKGKRRAGEINLYDIEEFEKKNADDLQRKLVDFKTKIYTDENGTQYSYYDYFFHNWNISEARLREQLKKLKSIPGRHIRGRCDLYNIKEVKNAVSPLLQLPSKKTEIFIDQEEKKWASEKFFINNHKMNRSFFIRHIKEKVNNKIVTRGHAKIGRVTLYGVEETINIIEKLRKRQANNQGILIYEDCQWGTQKYFLKKYDISRNCFLDRIHGVTAMEGLDHTSHEVTLYKIEEAEKVLNILNERPKINNTTEIYTDAQGTQWAYVDYFINQGIPIPNKGWFYRKTKNFPYIAAKIVGVPQGKLYNVIETEKVLKTFQQPEERTKEASDHLRSIFPTKESILLLKTTWGLTDLDVINLLYLTFPYLRSNPHVPGVLDDMQREDVGPPPPPKIEINMDAVLESKEATELMLGFVYDKYIPIYREKGYETLKNEIETVINPGSQGWEKKLAKKFLEQVKKIEAVDFSSFSQDIKPKPHQKEAVFRILNRKRTFIAQPIDSGKSYSFYGAKRIMEQTKNHGTRIPTIIVTTNENVNDFACKIAHLEGIINHRPEDVRQEALEHLQKKLREKGILVVNETTNPEDIDHEKFHTILVGQSKLSQSKRFKASLQWYLAELVCLDESHMFKNNETLTLREILRLVCRYDRYKKQKVVTMTATPMMSNLRDFISQILVCDPDTILPLLTEKAQAEFKKSKEKNRLFEEYFYTAISRFIQTIFEKPEFIRNFVRRFFLIDRVPEFQMEDYIERVAASDEEKQKVHDIRENKGHAQGDLVENDTVDKRRKIREFLMEPHGSKYQHCAEIIRKEKPERLCISTDSIKKSFTRAHKDKSSWGEALRKDFGEEYDIVELDGDVPQIERPKLIEQWRNGNKKCILLVNMEVVNFGLNLTCGDKEIELIMADSPWTSGEIMQFFGRFEREGQTASVRKHILQTDIDAEKARHEYTQDVHNLLYTLMRGEPIQQNLESVLRAMRAHEGLSKLNTSVSSDYQNLIKIYGFQRFCNYKNNIKEMREEMQKKDHPFEDKSMADFIREFYEREMKHADRYPSLSSNLFVLEHLIQQGFSGNLLDVCAGVGSLRQLYEMRKQKDGENMPEMHIMSTDVIADLLQTPDGVVADTANLPLKDDSVEMLTNLFGAHLFTDKKYNFTKGTEKALDEMVRVTEPGGKILMTIPLPTEKLLQYPRKRKGKHGKDESQKEDEPRGMPLNRYTRVLKQLQKYLRGRAHFTDASKICSYQHLDGRHYNFAFIEMEKEEATETTHEAKRSASSL